MLLSFPTRLQPFGAFDVEEVFVSVDGHFAAGGFVAGDDRAVVHLEGAAGPLLADAAFHALRKGAGFVVAVNQDEDFLRIHDGADADRQSQGRDLLGVISEETGIDQAGLAGQGAQPGARGE